MDGGPTSVVIFLRAPFCRGRRLRRVHAEAGSRSNEEATNLVVKCFLRARETSDSVGSEQRVRALLEAALRRHEASFSKSGAGGLARPPSGAVPPTPSFVVIPCAVPSARAIPRDLPRPQRVGFGVARAAGAVSRAGLRRAVCWGGAVRVVRQDDGVRGQPARRAGAVLPGLHEAGHAGGHAASARAVPPRRCCQGVGQGRCMRQGRGGARLARHAGDDGHGNSRQGVRRHTARARATCNFALCRSPGP